MKTKILTALLFVLSFAVNAQNAQPEMADVLRENGKINVVIGVILIIFIAIVVYLVMLERKLKKIEKRMNKD